jgi:hypothetical protein
MNVPEKHSYTSGCNVLLEKLAVDQLIMKFQNFYGALYLALS